jgi:glycoprotein 3-alpha-L-fucosyltransferase
VYLTAGVDKVEALRKYKFSLSFENSNVEDYVTEKFFQALVAGTVLENLCREFEN